MVLVSIKQEQDAMKMEHRMRNRSSDLNIWLPLPLPPPHQKNPRWRVFGSLNKSKQPPRLYDKYKKKKKVHIIVVQSRKYNNGWNKYSRNRTRELINKEGIQEKQFLKAEGRHKYSKIIA